MRERRCYPGVGLPLLDEVDRCALRNNLLDDVAHLPQRSWESANRRNADRVFVANVLDALAQGDATISATAADLVREDSAALANRFKLPREIMVVAADTDVSDGAHVAASLDPDRFRCSATSGTLSPR